MERFAYAVGDAVRRRHVHVRVGDWVKRPDSDDSGEVLALGPGLMIVVHFMSGPGHQRSASAGESTIEPLGTNKIRI